jgi:hypothetical protein
MNKMAMPSPPRTHVHVTAYWGNDDAESSIKLSHKQWAAIQAGAEHAARAWGWYEGTRFSVHWSFINGRVSIDGPDGMGCIFEVPVAELSVEIR